jgi:hypothetical protein
MLDGLAATSVTFQKKATITSRSLQGQLIESQAFPAICNDPCAGTF